MSGAALHCCRICGHRLYRQLDAAEGTVLELEESCPECDLYHYQFSYGHTEERVGVIVSAWGSDDFAPPNWREQEAEAQRLWASGTAMGLVRTARADPDAETPRKVLADWCDDNGLPLSAAYLRGA